MGGTVRHVPRAVMRVASVALQAFNPSLAALIAAALVMDTRDMKALALHGGNAALTRLPEVCRTVARGASGAPSG